DIIEVQPAADNKSAVITAKKTGRVELIVINSINGTQQSITITVEQPITSISLSEVTMSKPFYQQGYNMNRNLSYAPTNATNTDVKWVSSDESVAYIDEDEGLIQFISAGTALISVYPVKNPNGIMASCLLTIVGSPNAISLDKTDITLNVSESSLIDVDFSPRNTETTFEITPTNEGIVNVSYDEDRRQLKVDAKKPGQTNLNLVSLEGLISVVKVTVKQPATAVAMTPKEVTVRTGSTVPTKTTLTPATSTDTVKYSTLDARIATVDANGNITGVSSGTTFVRVQTYNGTTAGPTDLIKVIVRDGVTGISIDSTEKTVEVGSSVTITTTFTPPTAYDKSMTWTSSNPSVAKVENSGVSNAKVTGVKEGIVLITGKSNDGSYTVACLVTVIPKSTKWDTKVTIKPATKYLQVKKSAYLTATVTGSTNKKVTWKSSKKSVVTVSSSGKITGKKIGTAYVTATAKDGSGASARCKVRVVRKAKKVKLNKTSAKVLVGNTLKLKATVSPKNATIKKVKWKSSNKSIATVTASGRVLGVSPGRVKITATTTDGSNKKAVCYLTVKERVDADSIAPEQRQITVAKGKMCMANMVLSPSNSTSKIRYYSDNKRVATVNSRGKITTKRVGQAFIYAETDNGLEAYCEVLVVDLNRKDVVMRQYDTEQLSLNEELDKNLDWNGNGIGSNQDQNYQASHKVTWYSKNPRIASVSSNGLVTGKKKGTTIVYAVINGIKLGCRVTVRKIR
ncbi:MAG: Ig-like domain-containing protein, partial [Eubacterium sp.]|nr:Ig-like domain-containing protein [Eubacterium sp.]